MAKTEELPFALKMKPLLAPLIQVQLVWATHHAWKARQNLRFAAPAPTLWLITQGEIELSDGFNRWQMGAGEAFLWSASLERSISTRGGAQWLSLGMHVNFFDHLELQSALQLPVQWRPTPGEWEALVHCTRELVRHWHDGEDVPVEAESIAFYSQEMDARRARRSPVDTMIAQSLARAVFGMCWKRLAGSEAARVMGARLPDWLAQTLRRIHDEPLTGVSELARQAGFSPAQFRRSFGEHVGVSPRSYLLNHRLEMARRLLEQDDLPVSAIAARCGFSSSSHFIHLFKRSAGLAPLQYRQASRAAPV